MTKPLTSTASPQQPGIAYGTFVPRRTVIEAFDKSSAFPTPPAIGFGSSSRPPLMEPTPGPGPGAYPIKTTMGKLPESHITSPCAFTLKGRENFGDPNAKALSKTTANEPGPAAYNIMNKFVSGSNPRKSGFPKAVPPRDKAALGPGPGSYKPMYSMGKQVLSSKHQAVVAGFPTAPRPGLAFKGASDVGPGEYKQGPAACEPQVDSRRPTCATIKFGTGYRKSGAGLVKEDLAEPSPGPGQYKLPGGVATAARGSPYRNSPAAMLRCAIRLLIVAFASPGSRYDTHFQAPPSPPPRTSSHLTQRQEQIWKPVVMRSLSRQRRPSRRIS